ncbi:methylmalonyl-CoA mutase family protein [Bacillus sp. B190/17]|uniref:Methylmalonyl-CoA mutase family protein n=1 Tax=Bacillus lumedeiriae TaxID=3058829 RepID=A0ABW8I501_9BACI
MRIQEMKAQQFPKAAWSEWRKTAEASLNGQSLQTLHTATYENILLKPLYGREETADFADQYPGFPSYTRGFYEGGYLETSWKNAPSVKSDTGTDLKKKMSVALQEGQQALSFVVEDISQMTFTQFSALPLEEYPLYIHTNDHFLAIASFLLKIKSSRVTGAAGTDIVSLYAKKGLVPSERALALQAEAVTALRKALPKLKTIRIDTTPYHEGGANAVQEIAIALAEAVFYIEWLKEKGWSPVEVIEKMCFHFAIGSQFFMEIAKLRAFRKVWYALCSSYGVSGEAVKVLVGAETSIFTFSKLDSHVNLLRTGSGVFSALLGGVEYVQAVPFDQLNGPSSLGERMARNIPLILQHESYLGEVIDPAGGSYYIETLTTELSQAAWEHFIQMEAAGGIISVLKDGTVQKELAAVMKKRREDLATQKRSMIGTNSYADLHEQVPKEKPKPSVSLSGESISLFQELTGKVKDQTTIAALYVKDSGTAVIPISSKRLAEPFERLRERAERMQLLGKKVKAGLICLGPLKEFKLRADFVISQLSIGGIESELSGECQTIEEAAQFVKESQLAYYCICGKDEAYEQFGPSLAAAVKKERNNILLDLAGKLSAETEAKWRCSGLDGSVYSGQNIVKKLTALLHRLEGVETSD